MTIVRKKAGNAQTWDPLASMASLLEAAPVGMTCKVDLPDLSHAEALALRALALSNRNVADAIKILQTWGAAACPQVGVRHA
jgi:hypothetical protein